MRIIIDGDACPAKHIIKQVALDEQIPVHIFMDSAHYFTDDYFNVHIVAKGKDSVDLVIANFIVPNDLVITGDYGLATIALAKTNYVVNPAGFRYTDKNIDELLFKRHISAKARRCGKSSSKMKKRTFENDDKLQKILISIIQEHRFM